MGKFIVEGGKRLRGELKIQGSKNSALPILAACVLVDGVNVIHNCPLLSDTDVTVKILEHLGCVVQREGHTVIVDSTGVNACDIPDSLMREMRSSVVFLGAIIGRTGKAEISTPGGCEIGLRSIDLHISSIKRFGVDITEEHGRLECAARGRLSGCEITLSFPSVGATENIMLAAATAQGVTTIVNAAREPEISDLADFLNGCGARVHGGGEGIVTIQGVSSLSSTEHSVIPDRIAAATYMFAAAMTHGEIVLKDIIPAHIGPVFPALEEAGCDINIKGRELFLTAPPRIKRIQKISTMPYPGFPTDIQAPIMALTAVADGTSVIIENIFESRFKHIAELIRMGADIKTEGRMAVIQGVPYLTGASVVSPDLRGGSSLVLAGLAARGITEVSEIHHIDRGYEAFEDHLGRLGASITRTD